MITAPNLPIFYTNIGFTMSMDTVTSAASVRDMNQPLFTKVPTWCPSVNSPPNFRKPQYKEKIL